MRDWSHTPYVGNREKSFRLIVFGIPFLLVLLTCGCSSVHTKSIGKGDLIDNTFVAKDVEVGRSCEIQVLNPLSVELMDSIDLADKYNLKYQKVETTTGTKFKAGVGSVISNALGAGVAIVGTAGLGAVAMPSIIKNYCNNEKFSKDCESFYEVQVISGEYINEEEFGKKKTIKSRMSGGQVHVTISGSGRSLDGRIAVGSDGVARIDLDRHFGIPALEPLYKPMGDGGSLSLKYNFDGKCEAGTTLALSDIEKALASRIPPRLVVDPVVAYGGELKGGTLSGDNKGSLRVKLVNEGQGTAWGVRLRTEGAHPGIEYPALLEVGDLPPGVDRTVEVPITAGLEVAEGSMELTFRAEERFGNNSRLLRLKPGITVLPLERPSLLIEEIRIADGGGLAEGNGNRIAENGETIEIVARLRNSGSGVAKGVRVALEGIPEGAKAVVQEAVPGEISQGGVKEVRLAVGFGKTFHPAVDKIPLGLRATDGRPIQVDARAKVEVPFRYNSPGLRVADFLILDGDPGSDSQGNMNHMIDQDEQVEYRVRVENSGTLPAIGVRVELSTDTVPQLSPLPRHVDIGTLNSGDTREAVFPRVNVPVTVPAGPVQFTVTVTQRDFSSVAARYDKTVYEAGEINANVASARPKVTSVKQKSSGAGTPSKVGIEEVPFLSDFRRENAYALLIGVGAYKKTDVPGLPYAVADVNSLRNYLVNIGGFPEGNVKVLTDTSATLSDMRKHFKGWLHRVSRADSIVFVYYSGHGVPDLDAKSPYLLPHDGDPELAVATAYRVEEVRDDLDKLPAKEIVLAMDACYSGGGRSVVPAGARGVAWVEPVKSGGKTVVVNASRGDQPSWDYPEVSHGIFTYAMLKGMRGEDTCGKDGYVTLDRLFDYIKEEVPRLAIQQKGARQEPERIGNAKGIIISRCVSQ